MTDKIVRADSTVVTGIKSCTFKEQVNTAENLRFGACAASSIEFEVYDTQANAIPVGEVLTYYQTDTNNVDTKIGVFTAQTSIPSKNTYKVIAYDNLTLLETDFSEHLATIQSNFPMTLSALLTEVASVSGVTFTNSPASASVTIEEFNASGVSCRQVVSWAAEISGQFVRCDEDGNVEFAWYVSTPSYSVRPSSGSGGGVTYVAYKQDGLSYKNAACETVDRVAIKPPEEDDVAYIYPSTTGNTYVVSDNLLLTNAESATMNTIAQTLYTAISAISYRPATINIFREGNPYRAGDIVSVTDVQGVTFNTLVMSMTVSLGGVVLESTGRENYDSDSGSGVYQQLVNLANNIVRINKLKVDWAEIDTAIINYLTANNVTAQNLSIVNENGDVLATFDSSGIVLGESSSGHAEVDFNSLELYDQNGNCYMSVGDLRDINGEASVTETISAPSATTTVMVAFPILSITNLTVNGVAPPPYSFSDRTITFSSELYSNSNVSVTYVTTSPVYHYDLGTRNGSVAPWSVAIGKNVTASALATVCGGENNSASGYGGAVVGGQDNEARDSGAILGGTSNTATAATVCGGSMNEATGAEAFIGGGGFNYATGAGAGVVGSQSSTASGRLSAVVGGERNVANHRSQFVFGEYNTPDPSSAADTARGNYVEIVGNGTADNARSNARTLDWNGNERLAGTLYVNGTNEVATKASITNWSFEPNNTSALTSQIDALTANGLYSFYILSYGHQTATGMPTNANYYGIIFRGSASYVTVMAFPVGTKNLYLLNKTGGTWGSWSQNS